MATRRLADPASVWAALVEVGLSASGDGDGKPLRTQLAAFQRTWDLEPTGDADEPTISLLVDALEAHRIGQRRKHSHPCRAVRGRVASASGEPASSLEVQLLVRGFRSEELVATEQTDRDGRYAIAYGREEAGPGSAIIIRVLDGKAVVGESLPLFHARALVEIDVVVDVSHLHRPTEYERIHLEVAERIGKGVAIADLGPADVAFLAGATSWSAEQLSQLVVAAKLRAKHGIDMSFPYALFREQTLLGSVAARLQARFTIELGTPLDPLYFDIVLLDPGAVHAGIAKAIAERLVPATLSHALDKILAGLARDVDAAKAYYQTDHPAQVFDAVAADLQAGRGQQVLDALSEDARGSIEAIAARLTQIPFAQVGAAQPGSVSIGDLIKANPTIGTGLTQLASSTLPPADKTAAFTADLAKAKVGDKTAVAQADTVLGLLQKNPNFDLAHGHVDKLLGPEADPRLKSDLKTLQRVFKLAPDHRKASALLDSGLRSSAQIAALGETQAVAQISATGAFTAAEAKRVFHKAADVHAASGLLAAELRSLGGTAAHALTPMTADKLEAVSRDNPNLKTLFNLVDLCECKDCNRVTSPAAYFVDALQFLKSRLVIDKTLLNPLPTRTAKDVLFARRPDLGDTDLSCDNTNVPLPYIDLVCELLEEQVAPDPGINFNGALVAGKASPALIAALQGAGLGFTAASFLQGPDASGAFVVRDAKATAKLVRTGVNQWKVRQLRQTFRSSAELAAAPEYQNDAAYTALQGATYAFHLPFDLAHQESRGHFQQFGVARTELMGALDDGATPLARDVAAEALGLAGAERTLIATAAPAQQHVFWNTPASPASDTLKVVDVFLTKTGLDYAGLQDLLARAFVNPDGKLFVKDTGVDVVDALLDGNVLTEFRFLTCDTTKKQIAGLDDAALDRIHRFLRLQRALGWPMATLDRAVAAARLGGGKIDDALLIALAGLLTLKVRLPSLSLDDLIILYGRIPLEGDPSRYAQLFLNPSANGFVDPLLQPDAVKSLATKLSDVAATLAISLNVDPADLALLIARAPGADKLTFDNLAWLYGQVQLSRALTRPVAELLLLESMMGYDVLAGSTATARFVAESDRFRDAGIKPADLQFLLTFTAPDLAQRAVKDGAILEFLASIQKQLQAAFDKDRSPFDSTLRSDENRAGLKALVAQLPGVGTADLGTLDGILDATFAGNVAGFLDGLLGATVNTAPIKVAAAKIPGDLGNAAQLEADRKDLISVICSEVSAYLYRQARETTVIGAAASAFHLAPPMATALLRGVQLKLGPDTKSVLEWLGDDLLVDEVHKSTAEPHPPAITALAFPHQFAATRLSSQMALFVSSLQMSSDDVAWLLAHAAALGWLRIDRLPYELGGAAIALDVWGALQDALGLFKRYPPVTNPADPSHPLTLRSVFELAIANGAPGPFLDQLAAATGWDRKTLGDLDARFKLSTPNLGQYLQPRALVRLEKAVGLLRKLGLDVAGGVKSIKPQLDSSDARALRQALKARYPESQWLDVLKTVIDPIRQKKRDALVAYLLATNATLESSDDLFDDLLIDVEMCSCANTSRLVSAHGTLQLFVQRCLLGIEPRAVADVAVDSGWSQWTWMRNYRVWEANRKVFLYPEDWIEPTLRDDKSQPFKELEKALGKGQLTDQSVSDAAIGYLQALDEIAFLEVVALYYDETLYTLHVFARTKGGDPPLYYHRTFIKEHAWTPWEKVELDITGDHLLAFIRNARLHLAWPLFSEQPNDQQEVSVPNSAPGTKAQKTQKAWKIQLAVSELANGKWLQKRVSKEALPWPTWYEVLPSRDKFTFVPMDLKGAGFSIGCAYVDDGFYAGGAQGSGSVVELGAFTLTGCKGYPEPIAASGFRFQYLPLFQHSEIDDLRFFEIQPETAEMDQLAIMTFLARQFVTIFETTPGRFKVTYPREVSTIDYMLFLLGIWLSRQGGTQGVSRVPYLPLPLGTFMPYFYEDGNRGYVAIPGFFSPPDQEHGGRRDTRLTFSDALALVQRIIALVQKYLQLLLADPQHDVAALLAKLVADVEFIAIREQIARWAGLTYQIEVDNFHHPLVCFLREKLYADGIGSLMSRDTQLHVNNAFQFNDYFHPAPIVLAPYAIDDIDFTESGAYSSYNWELFFHLPFQIATRLRKDQQFEQAMKWFHYVFDPTDASSGTAPQKYWKTKPFYLTTNDEYRRERIDTILNGIASDPTGVSISELKFAVAQWRDHPFEPFLVARSRTVAFQQALLMSYLDTLIAWGDSLFTQGTMESVNQATQMYVLADKLLGPKPRIVPPIAQRPPETFNSLETKVDLFGNALLDLENLVPDLGLLPHGGAELPPSPLTLSSLYFCLPPNEKMLQYWSRVDDRLFKIRHCQDINGVERPLALFAPPIDPGALVAALAAGLSLADVIAGLNSPVPFYRFSTMAQKATELTQQVLGLGSALLSALEKRDGEALARLKNDQEARVLAAVMAMKQQQVSEAVVQLDSVRKSIDVTTLKSQYYHSRPFMNAAETLAEQLTLEALVAQAAALLLNTGAAIAHALPSLSIGVAGFGGSPTFSIGFSADNIAGVMSGFAQVKSGVGTALQTGSSLATTLASHQRRMDDWQFQAALADKELIQLGRSLDAAVLRQDIAQKDVAQQQEQIVNSAETLRFLQQKFTNQELYEFLIDQLSTVYFQAYQLAFACAHKAERCFQHELGSSETFIGFGYWDNLRKGLTAGELLMADLKRMESAYYDQNRREEELTKNISLAQLDPTALLALKNTGSCNFGVPEVLFDIDHPGHYMRRIKSVALTVPCVAGPYATVSAKLSLVGNRYRKNADLGTTYPEDPGNDSRFVYNVGSIQSISTSQAQNDSGLFELNFRDERYLPFEGQGALGNWRLEMPQAFKQFDYNTITDVILHLRYTARDGGSPLRAAAEARIHDVVDAVVGGKAPLYQGFNLRVEYPDQWFTLKQSGAVQIEVSLDQLPYFAKGHAPAVQSATWLARVNGDPGLRVLGGAVALTADPNLNLSKGSSANIPFDASFSVALGDPSKLLELSLVVGYTLAS